MARSRQDAAPTVPVEKRRSGILPRFSEMAWTKCQPRDFGTAVVRDAIYSDCRAEKGIAGIIAD